MQAALRPNWAARMAAIYPPGPAPMTTRSCSRIAMLSLSFSALPEPPAQALFARIDRKKRKSIGQGQHEAGPTMGQLPACAPGEKGRARASDTQADGVRRALSPGDVGFGLTPA